jgi:hypothetical protein
MQRLKPFQGSLSTSIDAELSIQGSLVTIEYKIESPETVLGLPTESKPWSEKQVPRKDGLWATTCFEAFLNPVGSNSYFEFNFSLEPAWNVYEFTDYREPQPPKLSNGFSLKTYIWNDIENQLLIELENQTPYSEFNVSLTTVIEEKNHSKLYLALAHTQAKPDFHAKNSFTLKRGSKK